MPVLLSFVAAALSFFSCAFATRTKAANPVAQVMELLFDLKNKIGKDGTSEEKAYKEYFKFCDDVSTQKAFEIKTAKARKEKIESKIGELTSDLATCESKIGELAKDIASSNAELKSATGIRDKEEKNYKANENELLQVIDTLGKAVTILQNEMAKKPALVQVAGKGLASVVQTLRAVVEAAAFSMEDKQRLLTLVQAKDAQPQDAYQSKSGGIFDVLEDLKEKAEAQLSELRKGEATANQNYQMLKTSLENQIKADNDDMDSEKKDKAAAQEAKSTQEGDLSVTVGELKQTTESLEMARSNCMQVAADHEASVTARNAELEAIAQATDVLNKMTSGAATATYALIQVNAAASGRRMNTDLKHSTVINLVNQLAQQIKSAELEQLSSRITTVVRYSAASNEDPFEKVRGMLKEMIVKLSKERDAAITEKAYCDQEMSKTEAKQGELDDDMAELSAKIDQQLARSASLKQEVQDIQDDLAHLAEEQGEAQALRKEANGDYLNSKQTLEQGLGGVRRALVILREYYATGDESEASLLQESSKFSEMMSQPSAPVNHAPSGGAGGGIIGILEVCESDFAANLAKLETEEDTAKDAYEKMEKENQVSKTAMDQDVKYKTQEFTALDKSITELQTDHDTASTELSAVVEYFAKLKDRCIAKPEPYEDRKAKREQEIAGLKEALSALENEAAMVQTKPAVKANMRGTSSSF
jgi:chromosome segregation ATPase